MKRIVKYLLAVLLIFVPFFAWARISYLAEEDKIEIKNPEQAQAFYAELKGKPDVYKFTIDNEIAYYVGLWVPKIDGVDKDYAFKIHKTDGKNKLITDLSGKNRVWAILYEPFTNDYYWHGPEIRSEFEPGKYKIKVYSPDNLGKYVLAFGEKEQFWGKDLLWSITVLPKIKHDYLGKSYLSLLANRTGWLLLGATLILTGITIVIVWLVKFFWKRNQI